MNTAVTYVGGELDRQRGLDFILVEFRFVLLILILNLNSVPGMLQKLAQHKICKSMSTRVHWCD